MKDWKITYVKRLGFGFIVALIMHFTNLISTTFQGATIMFLVTIVRYLAHPTISREEYAMAEFWAWLVDDSENFNLSGVGSITLSKHLRRKYLEWQSSTKKET